jgi:glutamate---cysteine ligase / carboxylate-amine ligase
VNQPQQAAQRAARDLGDIFTVGVEEEFLLVDPATGQVVPAVEQVMANVPERYRGIVQHEFLTTQIEIATPPTSDLAALHASLVELRQMLAGAARGAGVRLVALGNGALPLPEPPRIVDNPRYQRMARDYGALWPSAGLCGCHVHVGVPDRELGVQVLNHLRAWLPVLQAVTANSPFADGQETGYASWRSVLWGRWPTVGAPPHLESAAHYDAVLDDLVGTGAMIDDGMLYWYARLSAHVPTVEVRVGDVCPTVDDTLLVAALVRALVSTVVDDVGQGYPPRPVRDWLVAAAHWRAGHDGLEGEGVDVSSGKPRPAWELLRALIEHVGPALDRHGDTERVRRLADLLAERGSGAARQRRLLREHGDLSAVVLAMAEQTAGA